MHASMPRHINDDTHSTREKETKKIDWEIPRKAFHSSIGISIVKFT